MRPLILALVLCGCTTVGHERVEDWPSLTVTERVVPYSEVYEHCGQWIPWWAWVVTIVGTPGVPPNVMGCAVVYLAENRCDIWIRDGMDPEVHEEVLRHERLHCDGYDHGGSTAFRDALERHRL